MSAPQCLWACFWLPSLIKARVPSHTQASRVGIRPPQLTQVLYELPPPWLHYESLCWVTAGPHSHSQVHNMPWAASAAPCFQKAGVLICLCCARGLKCCASTLQALFSTPVPSGTHAPISAADVVIPIVGIKKLRARGFKWLAQGFLVSRCVVKEEQLFSKSKTHAFCYNALKMNEKFKVVGLMALFFNRKKCLILWSALINQKRYNLFPNVSGPPSGSPFLKTIDFSHTLI